MSMAGMGGKNGASQKDAYPASKKNAQQCWNQTSEDGTMYVLEGEYSIDNKAFWILDMDSKNDGPDNGNAYKKLIGIGNVKIIGSRPIPYHPLNKEKGGKWINIGKGAHHILIKNFKVQQVSEGIAAQEGGNHHLRLSHLDFQDTRQNLVLAGHPDCKSEKTCHIEQKQISHNIRIDHTSGIRYSKRHIRLSNGIHHVQVLNSKADSQFLDEDFAVGFDVENPSHDILFRNSESQRNKYTLSEYWNGDGFKAEDETYNIRWINCSAFENADGGFDIKTRKGYLQNITAYQNNRNIRSWHPDGIILKDANALDSKHHGGEGSEAGIWTLGDLNCHSCIVRNNKIQILTEKGPSDSYVRFFDSLFSTDLEESLLMRREEGTHVDFIRTRIWQKQEDVSKQDNHGFAYVPGKS